MRDAFAARILELAREDRRIMLLTADLGFGVLTRFAQELPDQFLNVGVAEQNMTGIATGLAMEGRIVFTYSIANFPVLRCLEQIRNDACYHDANVKIVAIGGGFSYGALGISHHATEDLSILRSLPSITVVAPGDDWEAVQATDALVRTPGVGYLRLDRSGPPPSNRPGDEFVLGRARMIRDGTDGTLISTGGMLGVTLSAADRLAGEGTHCRILSMHTVKPLDSRSVLRACRETAGLVTIEEHTIDGGLGGAVAEACMDAGVMPGYFHRVGLRAGFSSIVGSQEYLRARYGLDDQSIVQVVRDARCDIERAARHSNTAPHTGLLTP